MAKTVSDVMALIREHDIKMVDINGQFRHLTKRAEVAELNKIPTPAEFDRYYNL